MPDHRLDPPDFEREFGVNAAYAESLWQRWLEEPAAVDPEWATWFEGHAGAPPQAAPEPPVAEDADLEPIRGIGARIVENMEASREIPTATSVRTIPVKVLVENRRVLNGHMAVRALGKASFTHLIAFAMVRALREMPALRASFAEHEGRPYRRLPRSVHLGLAVDVPSGDQRVLLVPVIRHCEGMDFQEFYEAYEDLVRRARAGRLQAADFQGATATLTNPGGFGTHMSVPRLMPGQGLILATGAIGLPAEAAGMAPATTARLALGPVMTVTSTYDHRVIQGAESGLFLRRLEELLQGGDGFYEEIFASMRVPWTPFRPAPDLAAMDEEEERDKQARVWSLINAYRVRGHRLADLDPLEYRPRPEESLDPTAYGFTIWDLDREFLTGGMCGRQVMTLREILEVLRETYCRRWSIEYMHISERRPKHWLRDRVETTRNDPVFGHEDRRRILTRLIRAENFERFLHTRYVGNKRFSLEGADTLIPALAELIDRLARNGVEKVVLGMAHRGRLNVLANILNKSYEQIFREFEGVLLPLSTEGSGDVKYHLGQKGVFTTSDGIPVEVELSANPSHLEAVDPVVCGMVRGYQTLLGDSERKRVVGVLIHGDAAFTGQGVVAETLQMSGLPAYCTGGTIHIVVNNQIGFTAGPKDLYSTEHCTDVAKSIGAPVLHANGDYPESVLRAVHVACDYQREFGRDVVVDMVCYRRWGHNEGDEPAFTQPVLYRKIRQHPTAVENYKALLQRRGDLTAGECQEISDRCEEELRRALEASRSLPEPSLPLQEVLDTTDDDAHDWDGEPAPETGVAGERLLAIVDECNRMPEGHVTHPNLLRQLRRREEMVRGERPVDWGCAEAMAFGSLLEDGVSIRLAGQDSGRGTFSHRHAIIRDQETGADHVPLAALAERRGRGSRFEVRDSLLSEEAALGFEYGYSVAVQEALVLWEAQFGDFANGAQIQIDQFLASGEAKWKQLAGVTLLLPHGYDGQGPEHSSARIERFLALCSQGNMTLANCSTSAQYFHLLRRQGLAPRKRPLVVFTPKSLLRDPRAASPIEDFQKGAFRPVIPDPEAPEEVRRVLLCSGKLYHDLAGFRREHGKEGLAGQTALVRVEQLYPFPRTALEEALSGWSGAEWIWAQEEPRNMGAWPGFLQRFRDLGWSVGYVGRPASASPATGSYKRHVAEQEFLIRRAFGLAEAPV